MTRIARHSNHASIPSGHAGRRAWQATGDARSDLPPWVSVELELGAACASAQCRVEGIDGPELAARAHEAFARVCGALEGRPARLWTFLPGLTERCGDGLDRYMHLNIGRARAYAEASVTGPAMPAGTCVGHAGALLVVHALSAGGAFTSVENPRQQPAWRYSERFGPAAPPFSRGVRVRGALWASGTASVLGEETAHAGSLRAQWGETLANLEALRESAGVRAPWRCMRAYVRDADDLASVAALGGAAFEDGLAEVLQAPLCRSDLLVEVEGIAGA